MTYEFAKLSGTSMSSPATAGVIALMLEAEPQFRLPGDVRAILELTAREDDDTGTSPAGGDPRLGARESHRISSGTELDRLGLERGPALFPGTGRGTGLARLPQPGARIMFGWQESNP